MSYDEEVRDVALEAARKTTYGASGRPNQAIRAVAAGGSALDAIPFLTLKTKDGRFVKVEQVGWSYAGSDEVWPYSHADPKPSGDPRPVYRIVEDPE